MKPLLLLLLLINSVIATGVSAAEAVVSIAPQKVRLVAATLANSPSERLTFSISNRTGRNWRFSRFYESWSPILVSATGVVTQLRWSRDATRFARLTDYPLLKSGQRATTERFCRVSRDKEGLFFSIGDGTGGIFSGAVVPGDYKFAISYRVDPDGHLLKRALGDFGFDVHAVWSGWVMSNWMDLTIRDDAP